MGTYLDIHKALTQSLIDLSLDVPIAHENVDFDPSNNTTYTSDASGYAIGETSITLISGEGTIFTNDIVTFKDDLNEYKIVTGIAVPGSIIIAAPGLVIAIPAAVTRMAVSRTQFVDVTTIPASTEVISKDTLDEELGIYQLSVYTKSGISVKKAYLLADVIFDFYKHGVQLTSGTQKIFVDQTSRNAGRNRDGWFIIDLSINFIADLSRG